MNIVKIIILNLLFISIVNGDVAPQKEGGKADSSLPSIGKNPSFNEMSQGEEIEKKEKEIICNGIPAYIPSRADLFIEVVKISEAIAFINSKKEYFALGNLLLQQNTQMEKLKNGLQIDLSNPASLKQIGIDIDRSLYIANIRNLLNEDEKLYFIPVLNKDIILNYIKIIKKLTDNNTGQNKDIPINRYNNYKIYQIQSELYITIFEDYLILAQSDSLLIEIIDLKTKSCELSLSMNPPFKDYKIKSENDRSGIVKFFITKDFFNSNNTLQKKNSNGTTLWVPELNFLMYMYISIAVEPDGITMKGILPINTEDIFAKELIQLTANGMIEKAIYADNPIGYHFLSIDINKLNNYCKISPDKDNIICKAYNGIFNFIGQKGIFSQDILVPCSNNFINMIVKKSKNIGEMDNFVFFIPVEECNEIEAVMKNIKEYIKNKYKSEGASGDEKINGIQSYWYRIDKDKIDFLVYKNNLYAGNNIDLIKNILSPSGKNILNIQKDFIKGIDKNTFLLSYTEFDDESFIKAVLMMLAFSKSPELYSFISKIQNITLIGKRNDLEFNFNLKIKMYTAN